MLRNTRLRSSILQDKISEIGRIREFEREINLNADKKRLWFEKITSLDSKTMNESMPLSLNFIAKENL